MLRQTDHGATTSQLEHGKIPASSKQEMDNAIKVLQKHKESWARDVPIEERVAMMEESYRNMSDVAKEWAEKDIKNRGVKPDGWDASTSTIGGPGMSLRLMFGYIQALKGIQKAGRPIFPGRIKKMENGQLAVPVFPGDMFDKLLLAGCTADVILQPGVKEEDVTKNQALPYQDKDHPGKVALVLGAGNYTGIITADVMHKLITEKQVVLLKMHPVTEYVGSILSKAFKSFIDKGILRIVYGGATEGDYLCKHEGIDEILMTGSDKTFEGIVYGFGPEGQAQKEAHQPINHKRMTAELGCVSPLIVIPGPWKKGDIEYHAENIASMVTANEGFNCNSTRVILQHKEWDQRETLLDGIKQVFANLEPENAYYPGAKKRIESVLKLHPEAEVFGDFSKGHTPWTLLSHLDPNDKNELCFKNEIFGSFMAETAISAKSVPDYIDKAVAFCNARLWGNLSAVIVVHPKSLKDPEIKAAYNRAIANLRYGTVSVNLWSAVSYLAATPSWGGYPGSEYHDVQSGVGLVHNLYMLDNVEKSVFYGPFKVFPKPAWFPFNKKGNKVSERLMDFEGHHSIGNLMRVLFATF